MLPSMRHFLKFIDFHDEFNSHGFIKKVIPWWQFLGAAFN